MDDHGTLLAAIRADEQPARLIAYDITPGWRQPTVHFEGPSARRQAAHLWGRCHANRDARFFAINERGEEFGTRRNGEQPGGGRFINTCQECDVPFTSSGPNDPLCPGCEILLSKAWSCR